MNLDEAQRKKVAEWIAQGLKLSEIQNRLNSELGFRMTYMEVRMLVDDLKLVPKDIELAKPIAPLAAPAAGPAVRGGALAQPGKASNQPAEPSPKTSGVAVSVDRLARPGAVVSGKVTFSDGNKAEWYLDQSGRLGLVAQQPGYRPPPADLQEFQAALDAELNRMGF